MDLKDVCYFGIVDSYEKIYYELNYTDVNVKELLVNHEQTISMYKDQPLFIETKFTNGSNNLHFILLAHANSNELFVSEAFNALIALFDKIMKNGWTNERFETKYDMFVYAVNEFIFNGIILEDNQDALYKKLQKRTFESIGGIKVNKGLASMLNNAAKSVKNSFTLKK